MNLPLIYGSLNPFLATFSFILGNTSTPKHTSTNANKVPMLVKSVMKPLLINKEGTATINPVRIVENPGVWYLGSTSANFLGNKPSLLMLIQILGCPIWNTSNTLVVATTALIEMM